MIYSACSASQSSFTSRNGYDCLAATLHAGFLLASPPFSCRRHFSSISLSCYITTRYLPFDISFSLTFLVSIIISFSSSSFFVNWHDGKSLYRYEIDELPRQPNSLRYIGLSLPGCRSLPPASKQVMPRWFWGYASGYLIFSHAVFNNASWQVLHHYRYLFTIKCTVLLAGISENNGLHILFFYWLA